MSAAPPKGFVLAESGRAAVSDKELAEALAVANRACDRAREEIMPRLTRRFDKVDGNADGKVTKAEVEAHVRKRDERKVGHIFALLDRRQHDRIQLRRIFRNCLFRATDGHQPRPRYTRPCACNGNDWDRRRSWLDRRV